MKLYIDYDTTLVDLIDPWLSWINKKYDVSLRSIDINRWYFLGEVFGPEADDFWRSKKYNHYTDIMIYQPYFGAVAFFKTVQKLYGKENVFIVTSTRDHHTIDKLKHAKHYFNIQDEQFITVNKEKFHKTTDGILVDDYPLHVFEHIVNNKRKGIVFNYENRFGWCQPYNYHLDQTLSKYIDYVESSNFSVVSSYDELLKELSYE